MGHVVGAGKLGNASIVGQFTFGLAVSSPLFVFTGLQLRSVQATDSQSECGFADCFTLRSLATRLDCVSSSCVAFLDGFDGGPCHCASDFGFEGYRMHERCGRRPASARRKAKRVAISLTLRGGTSVAVFSWMFAYSRSLAWRLLGCQSSGWRCCCFTTYRAVHCLNQVKDFFGLTSESCAD